MLLSDECKKCVWVNQILGGLTGAFCIGLFMALFGVPLHVAIMFAIGFGVLGFSANRYSPTAKKGHKGPHGEGIGKY
jgi:hypothetical protein